MTLLDQKVAMVKSWRSLESTVEMTMGMGFAMGMGIPWDSHGNGNWWQNWEWEWEGMGNNLYGNWNGHYSRGSQFPSADTVLSLCNSTDDYGNGNWLQNWEWEWEGMGIDCTGMGGSGNVKSHSRASLVHSSDAGYLPYQTFDVNISSQSAI